MMYRCLTFLILFFGGVCLQAQSPAPGGVSNFQGWLQAGQWTGGAKPVAHDSIIAPAMYQLNSHPVMHLNADKGVVLPAVDLQHNDLLNVIAVLVPLQAREQQLLSVESVDSVYTVLSNQHLANLSAYDYQEFDAVVPAGIYTFVQHRRFDTLNSAVLLNILARSELSKSLPPHAFSGIVAEAAVYTRRLTALEMQQVQTYLALKYGIALEQGSYTNNYVHSGGKVIWDAGQYKALSYRVTGLGCDSMGNFYQRRSESVLLPQSPAVRLEDEQPVADKSFFLWGDNNASWNVLQAQGEPKRLQRCWKTESIGNMADRKVEMSFKLLYFPTLPVAGEYFWLMLDESGTGNFPIGKTIWRKESQRKDGAVFFDHLDASRSAMLTLAEAPAFFVRNKVEAPSCTDQNNTSLWLEAIGGIAPYSFRITAADGRSWDYRADTASILRVNGLPSGAYRLSAVDAAGRVYNEAFSISSTDGPDIRLADNYTLPAFGGLNLDGALGLDPYTHSFVWSLNGEVVTRDPVIHIATAGYYTLTVSDRGGCASSVQLFVNEKVKTNIKDVRLYPNPSPDGRFGVRINLYHAAPVSLQIVDLQGNILWQRELPEAKEYHAYECYFPHSGYYLLQVSAGEEVKSINFIVH